MRNPNGFGGVDYLGKKRRRPYRARKTIGWEIVDGKARQKYKTIGYYATRKEALEALATLGSSYDPTKDMTFIELYKEWEKRKGGDDDSSRMKSFKGALPYYKPLYDRPFRSLKVIDYETIITEENVPRTMRAVCKTLLYTLYNYAIVNEYCEKDYSKMVDFHIDAKTRIVRNVFTADEINELWGRADKELVAMVLVALYTGFRPCEVSSILKENVHIEEGYIVGGSKTEAGKNRQVPIHPAIKDIVIRYMETGGEKLFSKDKYAYSRYIHKYIAGHTPHDTRHTFATQWKLLNLDEMTRKKIMGHTLTDLTEAVYTHLTLEYMKSELEKFHY